MWQVINKTPFATEAAFARDGEGNEHWVIALRAGFEIGPEGLALAEDQPPPALAPVYDDQTRLIADSDFLPFAPTTDILVGGTLLPERDGLVGQKLFIRVADVRREALVVGPRRARLTRGRWQVEGQAAVAPTELAWRNAYGGTSPLGTTIADNPGGTGAGLTEARKLDDGTELDLPTVIAEGHDPLDNPKARPIGFGPVDRHRPARAALAGTYDAAWEKGRAPLLPRDFDPRFYLSAPAESWPGKPLSGGEPVELAGFGPGPALSFRLPEIVPAARARFAGSPVPMRFRLARVDLTPGATPGLSMLYLATLACGARDAEIESATVDLRHIGGVRA